MSVEELLASRAAVSKPYVIDIDPERAPRPIVMWFPKTLSDLEDRWSDDLRVNIETKDDDLTEAGAGDPKS